MAATLSCFSTSIINKSLSKTSQEFSKHSPLYLKPAYQTSLEKIILHQRSITPRATLDNNELVSVPLILQGVEDSVKVLKTAAENRKVAADEILDALTVIKSAKLDPSGFLDTLGGTESPGRTWMLIFNAEVGKKDMLKNGSYFPITAVQRFDAAAKRIENGVFFGPIGYLTFEGRFSWKKKILAFVFEKVKIKVGPFDPLQISLGQKDEREPSTKDPFFIWLYVDEEIAVAQGRGGGIAFWCRCSRVA
ncbi:hypothetical protein GIB67_026575 [Kingdonia uniflora]|uniref:PAP fibrillin n=1 Tax=Kingdonia uniflora TaxID=39325 RepID=A0A7J7NNC1_9MAGN|nr:hypothetical protein GIB67_026575 [Kingdonia uniflora]